MAEIPFLLERGVCTAAELREALGVSPATLMRRVDAAGAQVLRIGRARATRYGLRRAVAGLGADEWPLVRIDAEGHPVPAGRLVSLAAEQTAWMPAGVVFDGLPPEIADMAPSGFLGRAFPAQHPDLRLPSRIEDWSDWHLLTAIARRGEDATGNLLVGEESLRRWYRAPRQEVSRSEYPRLAQAAMAGMPAGSSPGGERPKFTAFVDGQHVMVKFAARGTPVAERWGELLAMEAVALAVLRDAGIPSVDARLIDAGDYRFLEIRRFDRVGARGRRAVMTLATVHQGLADSWALAGRRLHERKLIGADDARRLRLLEAFARLIGNTDRHHYNIALFPLHAGAGETAWPEPDRFLLAPAFDQLPMCLAPTADGRVPPLARPVAEPGAEMLDVWAEAEALAEEFWGRVGLK